MRFLKYLNEKFFERMKNKYTGGSFEIFVNPTKSEMKSIKADYLRFMADSSNKKLYVWDGDASIHIDVWNRYEKIKKGRDFFKVSRNNEILFGVCELIGGNWVMNGSDELESRQRDEWGPEQLLQDFKWVNKYINVDKFLEEYID